MFIDSVSQVVQFALDAESLTNYETPSGMTAVESTSADYKMYANKNHKTHKMIYSNEIFVLEPIPDNPAVVDKTSITANETDLATISDIVVGSLIDVSGIGVYNVDDGVFQFSVDTPGSYSITCISPDYLNKEIIVNAS